MKGVPDPLDAISVALGVRVDGNHIEPTGTILPIDPGLQETRCGFDDLRSLVLGNTVQRRNERPCTSCAYLHEDQC